MFKKNRVLCKVIPFLYLSLLILPITFHTTPAFAHKVTIFAWVEGDTIYTQSKFSKGRKVKGSLVTVFDMEGNKLLEGTTDEKGEFSFKIPKKTGLKVVLKASMGQIISMLADSQDQDPGIREVMGGIGYIFGLVGVALYFTNRRKTQEVRGQRSEVEK
jgi:hypothetical protein